MYTCPNCNKSYDIPMNFCVVCGAPMSAQEPGSTASKPNAQATYAESQSTTSQYVQAQPQYTQPQYVEATPVTPVVPTSAKVKSIVGMALSIEGLTAIPTGILYTLVFLLLHDYTGTFTGITFFLMCLPFCLVGLILSKSAINSGSTWKIAKIGKILGIIGIIICGVLLLMGIAVISYGNYNGFFDTSYLIDDYYYY